MQTPSPSYGNAHMLVTSHPSVRQVVIGRVLSEDAWTRRWLSIVLGPLPLVGRLGFLGEGAVQDLENQERGRREDEQKEGQRSGGVVGQDVDEDDDTSG